MTLWRRLLLWFVRRTDHVIMATCAHCGASSTYRVTSQGRRVELLQVTPPEAP